MCQTTSPSQTARILYEEPTDNTQQAIDYTENELFTISSNEIVSGVSREIKTPTIPKVTVNVLGTPVEFFIDTGSSVNVIDDTTFKCISHSSSVSTRLSPTAAKIFAYGIISPLQVLGQITCPISFQHTETTALFYVTRPQPSSKGGNLINSETAQKLQLIKLLFEHSDPIHSVDLLTQYTSPSPTVKTNHESHPADAYTNFLLVPDSSTSMYSGESSDATS